MECNGHAKSRGDGSSSTSARFRQAYLGGRTRRRIRQPAARRLGMSRIFWDTNLFIYLFEGSGKFSTQVFALRDRMLQRGDQLMTSAITLGEILVKPMQNGDAKAVAYYQKLIATTAAVTDLFITNDVRLHSKQISGIQFIAPLDRVPI